MEPDYTQGVDKIHALQTLYYTRYSDQMFVKQKFSKFKFC